MSNGSFEGSLTQEPANPLDSLSINRYTFEFAWRKGATFPCYGVTAFCALVFLALRVFLGKFCVLYMCIVCSGGLCGIHCTVWYVFQTGQPRRMAFAILHCLPLTKAHNTVGIGRTTPILHLCLPLAVLPDLPLACLPHSPEPWGPSLFTFLHPTASSSSLIPVLSRVPFPSHRGSRLSWYRNSSTQFGSGNKALVTFLSGCPFVMEPQAEGIMRGPLESLFWLPLMVGKECLCLTRCTKAGDRHLSSGCLRGSITEIKHHD